MKVAKEGVKVFPEVMIPLTSGIKEMKNQADIVRRDPSVGKALRME